MDWLEGMNRVVRYIEDNLTENLPYESLSRIVGCSAYEFSRIFSFMAGVSISEYIRRRRLSQAVFDLKNSDDKIIDIANRYCYESPTTFTRAFKELHGTTPTAAREGNVSLKTYPPISFVLTIKGVNEINFKIEKRDSFRMLGMPLYATLEDEDGIPSLFTSKLEEPNKEIFPESEYITYDNAELQDVSNKAEAIVLETPHNSKITFMLGSEDGLIIPRAIIAFDYEPIDGKVKVILGGELPDSYFDSEEFPAELRAMVTEIPAATWAVFSFDTEQNQENVSHAYVRILTEWFPASRYKRDKTLPHLEVINNTADSETRVWEIWMPVVGM